MERQKLHLLNPREYEHEFDRKALDTLEGTPGLEKLMRKVNKHAIERVNRVSYTGSYLKVNENSFPDIYQLLEEVCTNLNLQDIPELYINYESGINAFTIGSEKPIIVLSRRSIDWLSTKELLYVIGHEVGHIKSGHMLYLQMARILPYVSDIFSSATLGLGGLVSTGMEIALYHWYRMSEFTADRAGLLASQDSKAYIKALMKIAGLPKKYYKNIKTEEFIKQAKEFKDYDYDSLDKVAKAATILWQDHPWTVMRASELLKWIEAGKYQEIIDKHTGDTVESLELTCISCGSKLTGTETFCGNCGAKISGR